MKIPFTQEEFFRVFEYYNETVWPLPVIFYAMAIFVLLSVFRKGRYTNIIALSFIAFLWIWMGAVYHLAFFSAVNPAAQVFGVLFVVQGLIFLFYGVYQQKIKLEISRDSAAIAGVIFILYALVGYPILGLFLGHVYPAAPTFGVPCPTTIFTFGILLFAKERIPWYLLAIPFLWSLVGLSAAISFSIPQDFGLVVAGVVSTIVLLFGKPSRNAHASVPA